MRIGKLYKLLDDIEFFPENYYQLHLQEKNVPTFLIKQGTILLCTKIKLIRLNSQMGIKYRKETVFLYEEKFITPYNFEIDEISRIYFQRVL